MTISEKALTLAEQSLAAAGFDVKYILQGDIRDARGRDCAFISVSGAELSELDSEGKCCTAQISLTAQLLCRERDFRGVADFSKLCERAAAGLYFGSDMLIKSARLCGITRNMQLGRLEQLLEITAVYSITEEGAQV